MFVEFVILALACSVSFLYGFRVGRQHVINTALEALKDDPKDLNNDLIEFDQSAAYLERVHRIFHWGSELWPGRRYYGISMWGSQFGFWT